MWQIHITRAIRYSLLGLMFAITMFWVSNAKVHALSESAIVDITNQTRAAHGLAGYVIDPRLTQSAYAKAQDMIAGNYWAHSSPSGASPWTFIGNSGYSYTRAGENLAKGFTADGSVVQGWLDSPTHRAILLDSELQHIGVAVVYAHYGGVDQYLIVAHYGKSAYYSPPQPAEVEPVAPTQDPVSVAPVIPPAQATPIATETGQEEGAEPSDTVAVDEQIEFEDKDTSLELLVKFLTGIGLSSEYLAFVRWFAE